MCARASVGKQVFEMLISFLRYAPSMRNTMSNNNWALAFNDGGAQSSTTSATTHQLSVIHILCMETVNVPIWNEYLFGRDSFYY